MIEAAGVNTWFLKMKMIYKYLFTFRLANAILIVRQYSNNIDMLSPQKRETFFTMKLFRH